LPYEEGNPIPPGYYVDSQVRRGPLVAGITMAGSTYVINLLVGLVATAVDDERGSLVLIPGLGTWVYVGDECGGGSSEDAGCSFLVLHSLVHTAGVVLIIVGLAARKKRLVRSYAGLEVLPLVSDSARGMAIRGHF
jgi:hypothetical protein